jgi:hypothetical protein
MLKPKSLRPLEKIIAGMWAKMTDYCLYRLFGILREVKIVELFSPNTIS